MSIASIVQAWITDGSIKRCVLESDAALRIELGSVGHFHFYREFSASDGLSIETLDAPRHSIRFSYDSWETLGPVSQETFSAFKHYATLES